jgi:non-heme chloroperoxidase
MTPLHTAQAVEIRDGLLIPYIEHGDRDGVPLVLLHGVTDSHRSYEPVLTALPDTIHAYAITARGHGDAGKPDSYAPAEMAGDVIAFMDAVGIDRAIVAGHSMGSWAAQRVAGTYPERVIGAVLAGAFSTFRDRPEMDGLEDEFRALTDPIDPAYARAWQDSTLARPVPEAFMEMVIEETCKAPSRVWKAAMAGLIEDAPERIGAIAAPTLLVWGDRDAFVSSADQDALLARIPDAELKVYAGGGHAMHWEQPDRFAADVAEFASRLA